MFAVEDTGSEGVGETLAEFNDDAFFLGMFGEVGGKGSFTRAGDTKVNIQVERVFGVIDILESIV